jgi:hypothetical protein
MSNRRINDVFGGAMLMRETVTVRTASRRDFIHRIRAIFAEPRSALFGTTFIGAKMPDDNKMFRDPGDVPVLDWIDKTLIDVDPTYQRELDEARVSRMLEWFEWKAFGAIVVSRVEGGRYHAIDGQHRLEAARRHPAVKDVPAVIIEAKGTASEAENFVAINKDRRNVSALQLFWAQHAAGDVDAKTVIDLAGRAGLTVCRYPQSRGDYHDGDTISVGGISALIKQWGDRRAVQMLGQLAKGKVAPVATQHIKAAELLLTDVEFEDVDPDMLWLAVDGCRLTIDADAKAFAQTHRVPIYRAIASTWFRKARKRRKAA